MGNVMASSAPTNPSPMGEPDLKDLNMNESLSSSSNDKLGNPGTMEEIHKQTMGMKFCYYCDS